MTIASPLTGNRLGPRRAFVRFGLSAVGGLSLPGMLRLRAESPLVDGAARVPKAVIMVWQPGGCSHVDTYDPKPEATIDYRGPFQTIATKVPGLR